MPTARVDYLTSSALLKDLACSVPPRQGLFILFKVASQLCRLGVFNETDHNRKQPEFIYLFFKQMMELRRGHFQND